MPEKSGEKAETRATAVKRVGDEAKRAAYCWPCSALSAVSLPGSVHGWWAGVWRAWEISSGVAWWVR